MTLPKLWPHTAWPPTAWPLSRWLILSHTFNMDGRASSQTITDKMPYLMAKGIAPVVMSGVMGDKDKRFAHYQLLPLFAAGLRFDLRFLIRQWVQHPALYKVLIGAMGLTLSPLILLEKLIWRRQSPWSWALSAYLFGIYAIKKHKIDCIYSTGGAYNAHLAGLWLTRTTGLPLISEIHDPLVVPAGKRYGVTATDTAVQAKIERDLANHATLVWWFTQGALAAATKRHPSFTKNGLAILAGANPPVVKDHPLGRYQRGEKLRFAHFGSLSSTRNLANFFCALGRLTQSNPQTKDLIEVHTYGAKLDDTSQQAARDMGLLGNLVEHGRIEHSAVLELSGREQVLLAMQSADVLLVAHGEADDCAEYIPSKLYEYFWAGRPVLALTHLNAQMDALLQERGCYRATSTDVADITQVLSGIYQDWREDKLGAAYKQLPITVEHCVDTVLTELSKRTIS